MANCDAACKAKIILNGARVIAETKAAMQLGGISKEAGQQLIDILDEAEDKLMEWNQRRLIQTGYERQTQKFKLERLEEDK